ncbi:MAG: adenylate kinase [Mycobacteriales bacterium]
MRLVLIGPPGAGKGTQAEYLAAHFSVPKISTGELFRTHVGNDTSLGFLAKRYMDAGQLVPDEVTIAMVEQRLDEADASDGFLLDGFPRTIHQAEVLDELLTDRGVKLNVVLELVIETDEVVRRLSGRRTCHGCGKIWHTEFDPTSHDGVCDRCDGELFQREDDHPETVAHRLKVYAEQTSPLIDFYAAHGLLVGVDAMGPVEDVTERAVDALRDAMSWCDSAPTGPS